MTGSASPARWLPAALARRAVVPRPPHGGRHFAPEASAVPRIAALQDMVRAGRHTESEWSRALHDPRRDETDAFDWLGFDQE